MANSDVDDALLRIVRTVPVYAAAWDADPDKELPYSAAAHLAAYLADSADSPNLEACQELFVAVEDLIAHGSAPVRDLIVTGFLQDLQNATLQALQPLDVWQSLLGPATREAWQLLIAFWGADRRARALQRFVATGDSAGWLRRALRLPLRR
jgi:hypothetical protein